MSIAKREQLLKEIQELKEKLRDREAALPPHSMRPHQIQEIEELEERIAELEGKLAGMIKD
jgi:uncharacterized coiled-coil DUF342 family protein